MEGEPVAIMLVEDDPAHAEFIKRYFEEFRILNQLIHVSDGASALDYLYRRNKFANCEQYLRPGLILLDLRLPKIDGHEVLRTIKEDPFLCDIRTVILTTSSNHDDVRSAYQTWADSYMIKPIDFFQFHKLLSSLGHYWLLWNKTPN